MNRTLCILALAGIGGAIYFATSADAQAPTPVPAVWLQNTTPGTQQTGNINVSGRVAIGGNVGIGTSAPGYPLSFPDVGGDKITLWGQSGNHYGFGIGFSELQIFCAGTGDHISFGRGSSAAFTEVMRIAGGGNVGIGTTTPQYPLDVFRTTNNAMHAQTNNGGSAVLADGYGNAFGVSGYGHGTGAGVYGNGYIGVSGQAGASNFGVYAYGMLGASGTKTFRIDHPFDPLNKYLLHYCQEGPEPKNVYDGTVITDENGAATVALPDYFEEINRDARIQLTVDDTSDDFVMVKSVGGVKNASFVIRTSKPHVKVFWEVKATRNDKWVQKYGAPVEREKRADERGKYQHPELYGAPASMGMNYRMSK